MNTFKGLLEEASRINQALGLERGKTPCYNVKAQNGVYCLGLFSDDGSYSQVGTFGSAKETAIIIRGVLHGIAAAKVWLPKPMPTNVHRSIVSQGTALFQTCVKCKGSLTANEEAIEIVGDKFSDWAHPACYEEGGRHE